MVACGDDARHDNGIDEATCGFATGHLEDECEGGGSRVAVVETVGGVGDIEAED